MLHPDSAADEDVRRMLCAVESDLKASLAINRAALHAIAALSPRLHLAADAALDQEGERAAHPDPQAGRQVCDIIDEVRLDLQRALFDARAMQDLEQALVDAADALPDTADLFEDAPRLRAAG